MEFGPWLNWEVLSLAFTGLFITALGVWVFILQPGDERHQAFGLYLFLYGLVDVQQAIPFTEARDLNAQGMMVSCSILAAVVALAWFILVYPRPRFTVKRKQVVLLSVGLVAAALAVAALVSHDTGRTFSADGSLHASPIRIPFSVFFEGALAIAPLVFAIDVLRSTDGKERRALRLVAMACLVWPLYDLVYMGFQVAEYAVADQPLDVASGAHWYMAALWGRLAADVPAVVAAIVLLVATHRQRIPLAPVIVAILVGPAIALAMEGIGTGAAVGVADLALPVLVTIAILRGGLFGLDVKLRFAISKSTVAAIFIAVFFIASETAQQFFGAKFGGAYVGIAAAGGLVFAIAPLQRAAESLAEKAVPVVDEAGGSGRQTKVGGAETYRRAVRLALRDSKLTGEEEIELATIAHDLGLSGPDALRIRLAVEGEKKVRR